MLNKATVKCSLPFHFSVRGLFLPWPLMGYVSETGRGILLDSTAASSSNGAYLEFDALLVNHAYPEMTPGPFFVLLCLKFTGGAGLGSSHSFDPMSVASSEMVCGRCTGPPCLASRLGGSWGGRASKWLVSLLDTWAAAR